MFHHTTIVAIMSCYAYTNSYCSSLFCSGTTSWLLTWVLSTSFTILGTSIIIMLTLLWAYCSVPGKRPLPGERPYTKFQGVTVAASIRTYGIYIPGKCPCGPKSRVILKRPWALTRDTTVIGSFGIGIMGINRDNQVINCSTVTFSERSSLV